MDTTLKIALYGAIVSTVTGFVQVFNYRKDRVILKILVSANPSESKASILVVNMGRRPVTINRCFVVINGIPCSADENCLFDYDEGIELTEGKARHYEIRKDSISRHNLNCMDMYSFVRDTTVKKYWSHNFFIRWRRARRCKIKMSKVNNRKEKALQTY